jgi:hypothetical protein
MWHNNNKKGIKMPVNKITVSALIILTVVFGLLTISNLFSFRILGTLIDGALTVQFYYQAKTARASLRWPFYR